MALRKLAIDQAVDADVLVKVGPGIYGGFSLIGAAAGTIKVYDIDAVASVANTNLIDCGAVSAASTSAHSAPSEPVKVNTGLVVVVTGAANLAMIYYK